MQPELYGEIMCSEKAAAQKVLAIKEQFGARNEALKILLEFYNDLYKKITKGR